MSQPPAKPSTYSTSIGTEATTTAVTSTMAEIQTLPSLSLPLFKHNVSTSRQHPTRIQLPPLIIPPALQLSEHKAFDTRHTFQSQRAAFTAPPPPLRAEVTSAVPLDKLLSSQPNTPVWSDSFYSPNSPPQSTINPGAPDSHHQVLSQKHYYEDQRQQVCEPSFKASTDHQQPYSTLPSPGFGYNSQRFGAQQQHRYAAPLPPPPPPPPQVLTPSSSSAQSYRELGPIPPPPRITSSMHPPLQMPAQGRGYEESEHGPKSHSSSHRGDELHYKLKVRQQPIAARACGFGERDRRVIDPPPIIQLTVSDSCTRQVDLDELRYSLNIVHCALWSADGRHEKTALMQPDRRATRRLMGQLVASPSVARDEHDIEGCFFCFPDLSCRTHGKYRLRFVLMRIDSANLFVGGTSPILTDVLSDVFTVYTAKDFPGMRPSSALTRALKLQGCNIQVKKGNEKALARKRSAMKGEDADERDDQGGHKKLRN